VQSNAGARFGLFMSSLLVGFSRILIVALVASDDS
jgi:hypothetical protein